MICNRDSSCLNLCQNVYPNYKSSISVKIKNIKENIFEINELLNGLYIPDDYLGNKIKDKLEMFYSNLEKNEASLLNEESSINSFVDDKINEHSNHYRTWISLQNNNDDSSQLEGGAE